MDSRNNTGSNAAVPVMSPEYTKSVVFDPCQNENNKKDNSRKDIYFSNLRLDNINPVACGQHHCESSHQFGPMIREYYLLHYIISGEGAFYSHDREYKLSQGNIFIIRPNETTIYRAGSENPWFYRWVGFTSNLDLSRVFSEDTLYAPECDYLFRLMVGVDNISTSKEYYLCAKIFELVSLLSYKNETVDKSHKYVEVAKNYIETNYSSSHFSIAEIADNLNLNRSYFSTLFKNHTGKSPQEYLLDFRLNKATELLAVRTLKSGEVGRACGYTDQFNFSKMFKKKFGISPSQYANIQKEGKAYKQGVSPEGLR